MKSLLWLLLAGCDPGGPAAGSRQAVASPSFRVATEVDLDAALLAAATAAGSGAPRPETPRAAPARFLLGEALFWDSELSGTREVACASCHTKPLFNGMPGPFSVGSGEMLTPRSMIGFGDFDLYADAFFWDGRVERTADGLRTPAGEALPPEVTDVAVAAFLVGGLAHAEMLGRAEPGNELALLAPGDFPAIWDAEIARVLALPGYPPLFRAAFPAVENDAFTYAHAAEAMRDYAMEELSYRASPWDRWKAGEHEAMSTEAKRGGLLFFGSAGCGTCHGGPDFSDGKAHNLAVPQFGPGMDPGKLVDLGRSRVTGDPEDDYAFRTPSLRHVAFTAPYMHNGAYVSLEAAVRHHLDPAAALASYTATDVPPTFYILFRDGTKNFAALRRTHSDMIAKLSPLLQPGTPLTDVEVRQILAFLSALSDPGFTRSTNRAPIVVPSGVTGAI